MSPVLELSSISGRLLSPIKLWELCKLLFLSEINASLLPIFNVPAVIFANSEASIVILPAVPPKPIVPLSELEIVVEPVPLLSEPVNVTSFALRVRELFPVDNICLEIRPFVIFKYVIGLE